MRDTELIGRLGVWEGYSVIRAQRYEAGNDGSRPRVWVELAPIPGQPMTCDGCGRRTAVLHDVSERVIRDLPVFDAETYIRMPRRRVHSAAPHQARGRVPWPGLGHREGARQGGTRRAARPP